MLRLAAQAPRRRRPVTSTLDVTTQTTRAARQAHLSPTTMNAAEFRKLLLEQPCDEIVDNFILTDDPGPYTTRQALTAIEDRAKAVFGLTAEQSVKAVVVGSAKLGFSFLEKPARNGNRYKPAYRTYQPGESDMRHLLWARSGPCRHGICSQGANRYERLASSRKSYRQWCVMARTWWP